jgi:glycogen(starch) synthase
VISNIYPPEFLGGYELGCEQMVAELRAYGHEVQVVTSGSPLAAAMPDDGVQRDLELAPIYSLERLLAVSLSLQRAFHQRSRIVNEGNVLRVTRAIQEFQPDVVYLWNLLGLGGLGILALLAHHGVEWVWHVMDSIPSELCAGAGPAFAAELSTVFPGRYVMCSSHVLGEIRATGVQLDERIHILPNWVTGDPPPPRTEYFDGGELRMLTASGLLCEPKGTDIVIDTAARLRDQGYANFSIDVYGSEPDARFRAQLHRLRVADLVHLKGPRRHAELLELLPAYDLFLFPSWSREPFGFAPLEAAAAGCVPLVSAECGIAEWLVGDVDCLKAVRDPDHFADRIAAVLRGEISLAELGGRAQKVAWRDFHISRTGRAVEQLLRDAAAERRPGRSDPGSFVALAGFAEVLIQALAEETITPVESQSERLLL